MFAMIIPDYQPVQNLDKTSGYVIITIHTHPVLRFALLSHHFLDVKTSLCFLEKKPHFYRVLGEM